jgi:hypothetical protein
VSLVLPAGAIVPRRGFVGKLTELWIAPIMKVREAGADRGA